MKAPRPTSLILTALQKFANDVKADMATAAGIGAQPEDQLKSHVKTLVATVGDILNLKISSVTETPVEDVGRPDFSIFKDGLLVGFIELKAPGEGTQKRDLRGRNRAQFDKFMKLPNLIYTDAREWTRYVEGERDGLPAVRLGDVDTQGATDVTEDDARDVQELFRDFLGWSPIAPSNPKALAELLAPLTRMLRDDVAVAVAVGKPALKGIYADWKRTLFPEASPEEFADSYAQTVTYGLLLAKLDGATTLDTKAAAEKIKHHSSLLSRTLEILTQSGTREELGVGLQLLERTIEAVNPTVIRKDGQDPWLYFYEDFLAVYDPKLRNERGVYYTPAQVVKAQVALVDDLLRTKLNKPDGVADGDVTVLDPAVGTGTYLLQVLQKGIDHAAITYGPGAVGNITSQMANNLYGFELLVGPYAVAHLRLNQAIRAEGGRAPHDGAHIYLTDTLESPNESGKFPHSYFEEPLAEEHRRAREVKRKTKILVCIGNPPYEREEGDSSNGDAHRDTGSWIRNGDAQTKSPLETFLKPAREAGAGKYLRNLYNSYVYFWRWSLWKVFEQQDGPGIVSFITASSYLRGPSFVGMREEMRRTFDELWVVDLEGDNRGTRATENVFDIQTPVAIAVGVRYGKPNRDQPAHVHYVRVSGTRQEKFQILDGLDGIDDFDWQDSEVDWQGSFMPSGIGAYFPWPALTDLMPWQHAGSKVHRSWPIGEDDNVLRRRWQKLLEYGNRAGLFRETRDRRVDQSYPDQIGDGGVLPAIASLPSNAVHPEIVDYGFRTYDLQRIFRDTRVADRSRPPLWRSLSERQVFITTLLEESLSIGTAVSTFSVPPDMNAFNNRNGKCLPLYRDAAATEPNITNGLLGLLRKTYGTNVTPEDLVGYISGVLGHPGYIERFHHELEIPGPRVPLTKDALLFQRAVELGKQVVAWQTYAERFPEAIGTTKGRVPSGSARVLVGIPDDPDGYPRNLRDVRYDDEKQELHVGEGVIGNVDPRIWAYDVSGLRVVRSWLGYRMRERSGKKSSPLDDIRPERWTWEMTKELLELLHVLEGAIALEPAQDELLDEIVAGKLFLADELPVPTEAERKAPRVERQQQMGLF